MKSTKATFILIIIIFVSFQTIFAQELNIYFKPVIGISVPESETLKNYYNQNGMFTYGGSLILITSFYNLGAYLGFNQYSIDIEDNIQQNLVESGNLYKIGLIKRFNTYLFSFDTKVGLTIIKDKLVPFSSNNSRNGFEFGFSFDRKIYSSLFSFLEVNYLYDKIEIPEYVTYIYSRHQRYLSGKNIKSGGFIFLTGISFFLY